MKISRHILTLLLAWALLLTAWPGPAAAVGGTVAPGGAWEEAFVADEVLAPAASEEEARHIAEAYGLTLKSYAYGIAVLAAPDAQAAVAASLTMSTAPLPRGAAPLPRLSLNRIYSINDDAYAYGGAADKYERPTPPGLEDKYERPTPPAFADKYERPTPPGFADKYEHPIPPGFADTYERPVAPDLPDTFSAAGLPRAEFYNAAGGKSETVYLYGGAAGQYARTRLPYGPQRYGAAGWNAPLPDRYGLEEIYMQWQHDVMDSERAWKISSGANVLVAVIDTGIDTAHPDFAGRLSALSYNSHSDQIGLSYVMDDFGHGTHVSGIVAGAQNNIAGVSGVAPGARILSIKSNIPESPGSLESASWMRGLNYAVENGAQVVNMSFGRPFFTEADDLEQAVISQAAAAGVTVVCAACNDSYEHAGYPAAYAGTIAVSAIKNNSMFESAYSNYGPEIAIAAPGTYIYSTVMGGGYDYLSGTSMASPCVAGVAALIKYLHPAYSPQQVREELCQTAREAGDLGRDDYYGCGIVNAYAAVVGPGALYNVIFDYDDGVRSPVTVKVAPGSAAPQPYAPLRAGYAFDGWYVRGTDSFFNFEQAINGQLNLYARWAIAQSGMYFTEFPDRNFRREVLRLLNNDGAFRVDSSLLSAADLKELSAFTVLNVEGMYITGMTGLKYFSGLEALACSFNQLSALDTTKNTALKRLSCHVNQLSELNISQNSALEYVSCGVNNLSVLDVSKNTVLRQLWCNNNYLSALDVSQNTLLTELFCYENQLSKLDVARNSELLQLDCRINQLSELDVAKNVKLEHLYCDENQLTALDVSNNTELQTLWCRGNSISELDVTNNLKLSGDYDGFWSYGGLMCNGNLLTQLDVSKNTGLRVLWCFYNQLTTLNVSNNTELVQLYCDYNQLSALDVAKNLELRDLRCACNKLRALDVSKHQALGVLFCFENYMISTADVIGWQEIGLIEGKNFWFYPQRIAPEAATFGVLSAQKEDASGPYYLINGEKMYAASSERLAQIPAVVAYTVSDAGVKFCATIGGSLLLTLSQGVLASAEGAVVHPSVLQEAMNQSLAALDEQELYAVIATAHRYNSGARILSIGLQDVLVSSATFLYDLPADDVITNAANLVGQGVLAVYDSSGEAVFVAALGKLPEPGTYRAEFPDANFRFEVLALLNSRDGGERIDSSIISLYDLLMMASERELYVAYRDIADMTGLQYFSGLQYLTCDYNHLTQLDVSNNSALVFLSCWGNQLGSLDVSRNKALTSLFCGDNQLTALDVSQNTALTTLSCGYNQLAALVVSRNVRLEFLSCWGNKLSRLDVSGNKALTYLECGDNQLGTLDVSQNTALEVLYCYWNQLSTLDIAGNSALEFLFCWNNQFTSLDVSKNAKLTNVDCSWNQLSALDVSYNAALRYLNCCSNQLSGLYLAKDSELEYLHCWNNQLPALDVSQNAALTFLNCAYNKLAALDVSHNAALTDLYCDGNSLTTLDVLRNSELIYLGCADNKLSILDVSRNTVLWHLDCNRNQLSALNVAENTALGELNCASNQITALDVSNNMELISLRCYYNPLNRLDVTQNRLLEYLDCDGTGLSLLDVSKNTALKHLACQNNRLSGLDISQNAALNSLSCGNNQLSGLDVSKNSALEYLYCWDNQLAVLNISQNAALRDLNCGGNRLSVLDVSQNSILRWLSCSVNRLSKLDVSQNATLTSLDCGGNPLSGLDISNNTALEYLYCWNNQLRALDVSQNAALYLLYCTENYMISPDDVIGWKKIGLVLDETFFFYPQKSGGGVSVSGLVESYNPQHETVLELWREGGAQAAYTCFIFKEYSGSGQWTQKFAFTNVEPGTYRLVISKAAHTRFTVHNIVVADRDVDLTADARPEVQLMTLRCGDINGDGNINNSDLTIMWQQANYNRSASAADNELCDLNGDGLINNIDLTILWLAYNYNRGEVEIK